MTNLMFPFSVERVPSITSFYFADLGDNPTTHRWRAQWSFDSRGDCDGIHLAAHPVLKLTPCGAWINVDGYREATKQPWEEGAPAKEWVPFQPSWMKKRFINNGSGQGWAKPTREEALHSLAIRLCRWTGNIRREVERARSAAEALRKLRPQEEHLAKAAINNLKGIEEEEFWA